MLPSRVAVCLEVTPKQAVASALDWPGWCRADRDEHGAGGLRRAVRAKQAGVSFRPRSLSMSSSGCSAGLLPRSPTRMPPSDPWSLGMEYSRWLTQHLGGP
jgi:hypothetical protein